MTYFNLIFDIVILAYIIFTLVVLCDAAKRQNTVATILFFIAFVCNFPVVYKCFPRGGGHRDVWTEYFHDFNIEKIMIPGIGFIFFILGLCFTFFCDYSATVKEKRNARETAQVMKQEGIDSAIIAKVTGLPLSEIERMEIE